MLESIKRRRGQISQKENLHALTYENAKARYCFVSYNQSSKLSGLGNSSIKPNKLNADENKESIIEPLS